MNTWKIETETERKANSLWNLAETCLLLTAGVVAIMVPLMAAYGQPAMIGCGAAMVTLLASSGLLIRRAIKLEESSDEF